MKKAKSSTKINLTPNDMWSLRNRELEGGIEGYAIAKPFFDARQQMWIREREKILSNTKREKKEPKLDRDGNPLPPPKRPNFLDDLYKWSNSFYNKEKAEKTIEECISKGHPLFDKKKPEVKSLKEFKKREFFTDLLIKEEQKKYIQIEDRQDMINEIIDKIKEDKSKVKPYWTTIKENYEAKDEQQRLIRTTFGKSTRVTVVSEAEHVGEKYPFYNTYVNPDGDDDEKSKNKLFYPQVINFLLQTTYCSNNTTYPKWGIYKPIEKTDDDIERQKSVQEALKERNDAVIEKVKEKTKIKDLNLQIPLAFSKTVRDIGKTMRIIKTYKMTEDEQEVYDKYKEENPKKFVGPQHYWKYPKENFRKKKQKEIPKEDENGNKLYFLKRETTDKRVYKPMKNHLFQS